MAAAFVAEFAKYQEVEDNYTAIITDLLNTQNLQKFNFSDDNVTSCEKLLMEYYLKQNERLSLRSTRS